MIVHPKTGLHYIISFRTGPAYDDAYRLYTKIAERYEWIECITEPELSVRMEKIAADERNFVVMWGVWAPRPPDERKAIFTRVFSEALNTEPGPMLRSHRNWLTTAQRGLRHLDAAFGHTPWMAEQLSGYAGKGFVLPMGWDPEVFGVPRYHHDKHYRLAYLGALAGKRSWLVPKMAGELGEYFFNATGCWGNRAMEVFNRARANLYVSHSDIQSFSTFRIWQTVASSAAMIAESGRDCWPMTEDMYIGMPTLTRDNVEEVCEGLKEISDEEFLAKSRTLYEGLASYTIDYVVDKYLIPASAELKEEQ